MLTAQEEAAEIAHAPGWSQFSVLFYKVLSSTLFCFWKCSSANNGIILWSGSFSTSLLNICHLYHWWALHSWNSLVPWHQKLYRFFFSCHYWLLFGWQCLSSLPICVLMEYIKVPTLNLLTSKQECTMLHKADLSHIGVPRLSTFPEAHICISSPMPAVDDVED